MAYALDNLPLETLIGPVARATEVLTRLDERLARSPVREGWIERQNFADAGAALWLEGNLVHLEDLVLHDARMDVRTPTHELTRAHAVLRMCRRILAQPRDWALGREGLRELTGRGGAMPAAGQKAGKGRGLGPAPLKPILGTKLRTIFWPKNLLKSTLCWHARQKSSAVPTCRRGRRVRTGGRT